MTIYYYERYVYGRKLYYLSDKNEAKVNEAIYRLVGKKTIDILDIENLKDLGFELEQVIK